MVAALPPDARNSPTVRQLKSFPDAMQMLLNAEQTLGKKRVEAPDESWDDARWEVYYGETGRPAEAKDYQLGDMPGLDALRDGSREAAKAQIQALLPAFHAAGLHNRQVAKIVAAGIEHQAEAEKKLTEIIQARADGTEELLRKEYGDAYDAKITAGHEAAKALLADQFEPMRREMLADGSFMLDHPVLVRLFVQLGDMMEEGGVTPGAPGGRATLTPEEASAERNRLMADKDFYAAWTDKHHPQHKESVERMMNLRRMMNPDAPKEKRL
jgi:hypothetical protein